MDKFFNQKIWSSVDNQLDLKNTCPSSLAARKLPANISVKCIKPSTKKTKNIKTRNNNKKIEL